MKPRVVDGVAAPQNEKHAVGSFDSAVEVPVEAFVWDTVKRVRRLAELTKRHPEAIRKVSRQLLAWPVMSDVPESAAAFRSWGDYFDFELGRDYPLRVNPRARIHHSNEIGHYLTRWIVRLHEFRLSLFFSPEGFPARQKAREEMIRRCWPLDGEPEPVPQLVAVLQVAADMPALTRATSDEWSKRVLVPLIVAVDAGADEPSCRVPVLQGIWRQKGVKSVATFRSRLLSKVRQIVRDRVRPA